VVRLRVLEDKQRRLTEQWNCQQCARDGFDDGFLMERSVEDRYSVRALSGWKLSLTDLAGWNSELEGGPRTFSSTLCERKRTTFGVWHHQHD
jgi:hypothetical protein